MKIYVYVKFIHKLKYVLFCMSIRSDLAVKPHPFFEDPQAANSNNIAIIAINLVNFFILIGV